MRNVFMIILCIAGTSVFSSVPKTKLGPLPYRHFENFEKSYQEIIQEIAVHRKKLKTNAISLDSCRSYFLAAFEDKIFPQWVGTTWDYNGYSNTPGKGKLIACGYFVSTPLKHMGFNWNRFKLAQMYSKKIVETICDDMFKFRSIAALEDHINQHPNNLYIVGLDSHVGMILSSSTGNWFVHSNYYDLKGPDKEILSKSQALKDSESYYVGTFSTDKNMQKWLDGTLFPTE